MKKNVVCLVSLSFLLFLSACWSSADAEQAREVYPKTADERIQTISGRFYCVVELEDLEGNHEMLYQFRSDNDSVWWLLSAEEIGFVPELLETYYLTYDNSGTTSENKGCDCPPEYDCECEVYDDVFISVSPAITVEEIIHIY